jgi:hypothetical protein
VIERQRGEGERKGEEGRRGEGEKRRGIQLVHEFEDDFAVTVRLTIALQGELEV